ncbi:MAG: 23S rRNA (adenine(2503)-C(2))-methyltransferase RlmN [Spirochaetaceae bacterium]|jgi:23S rRNA (adenine2503-C2)-methyltransferase|nr:23S rRNA (adenine(2503)-C(2))-methyltransferase RlmN [Spirochaetaceae bacterium]
MPDGAGRPALSGLLPEETAVLLAPLPSYRAKQIFSWIRRGAGSFDDMTDLPRSLRGELGKRFSLYSGEVSAELRDPDGTVKIRLTLHDGYHIEAVLLTDGEGRRTACLSTQAGCPMGCVFCKTGALGFHRNLDSGEIVSQFFRLRKIEGDIANIVFMGMGEPLLNLGELRKAAAVLSGGADFSPRRITVSTSGVVPGLRDLAENGPRLRLALSLTTADEELRSRLMPVTTANPLSAVKDALRRYQKLTGRRITLEMVLLGGVNTRPEDADALAKFAHGLDVVVNLIPWNPVEGMRFEGRAIHEPGAGEIARLRSRIETLGLTVTRRYRKGRAIGGACGQLAGDAAASHP